MNGAAQEGGPQATQLGNFPTGDCVTAVTRFDLQCIVRQVDRLPAKIKQNNRAIELLNNCVCRNGTLRCVRRSTLPYGWNQAEKVRGPAGLRGRFPGHEVTR